MRIHLASTRVRRIRSVYPEISVYALQSGNFCIRCVSGYVWTLVSVYFCIRWRNAHALLTNPLRCPDTNRIRVDGRIRFLYATCGRTYFCIRIKKICGYKNLRIRVDGASNFIELIPSRSIRPILAIFFWSWILKDFLEVQEKKKEVTVLRSRPTQNVKLEFFMWQSCSGGKEIYKCTKKRDARAELLFCQSKPITFNWPFSLASPSSLLTLPFFIPIQVFIWDKSNSFQQQLVMADRVFKPVVPLLFGNVSGWWDEQAWFLPGFRT